MKKTKVSAVIVTRNRNRELSGCIDSLLKSSFKPFEIIVVDNASDFPVSLWIKRRYPRIKIIRSRTNVGAAEGRNLGISQSKGEYILFLDDDAYADSDMVANLLQAFSKTKNAGLIQPLVYDKKRKNILQGAGHDINITTGRVTAWGANEEDKDQYQGLREIPMCGCVWMVKREVFEKIGNFDPEYFIPYEDSDLCLRVRKSGYKIYCYSLAKAWHQGSKKTNINPLIEWLGITSPERAFRVSRNKILFMAKNAPIKNFLLFSLFFNPVYIFTHSLIILLSARIDILEHYWKGVFSGISWCLSRAASKINIFLLAWTDPLGWVVMKNPKSILDLGCGQGKPMMMIKIRTEVEKSVGMDIYAPYIEQAKRFKVHDKLIVGDLGSITFPKRSFDVVMANQVLEHLDKKDAWKFIEKIEKIARKQVIISTPIGEIESPDSRENIYQVHKSSFLPGELENRGYKTIKYGWRWLLAPRGLAMTAKLGLLVKFFYFLNFLLTPIYYLWQDSCDYSFTAYKEVHET